MRRSIHEPVLSARASEAMRRVPHRGPRSTIYVLEHGRAEQHQLDNAVEERDKRCVLHHSAKCNRHSCKVARRRRSLGMPADVLEAREKRISGLEHVTTGVFSKRSPILEMRKRIEGCVGVFVVQVIGPWGAPGFAVGQDDRTMGRAFMDRIKKDSFAWKLKNFIDTGHQVERHRRYCLEPERACHGRSCNAVGRVEKVKKLTEHGKRDWVGMLGFVALALVGPQTRKIRAHLERLSWVAGGHRRTGIVRRHIPSRVVGVLHFAMLV